MTAFFKSLLNWILSPFFTALVGFVWLLGALGTDDPLLQNAIVGVGILMFILATLEGIERKL